MTKEWPWWPPRATSARPRLCWVSRPAPRADSKFILKLLILITKVAGTWYYGTRACVKHHAVPDPGAPELTRSSRDFRSGGPGSINILIDPNDP